MTKSLFCVLKKIILSIVLLYSFNVMVMPLNINIPINVITVATISLLGIPSLISLLVILLIAF